MTNPYLSVLRAPDVPWAFAAALLGRLSTAMGPLALVLFMQSSTGSFALAGAAAAATGLASGLLAPVRGRLVDRYGHRRALPPLAILYAGAFTGVLVVAGHGVAGATGAVILAGAAGAVIPPLSASMRVLWVALVGNGPRLQTAYALDSVLEDVVYTIGPLLAAALVAGFGAAAGLAAVAALALAGTAAFTASPASRNWTGSGIRRAGWAGAMAGGGIRILVASLAGFGASIGILDITLVAAAREAGSAPLGGVLLACLSAGSVAGGLWYGSRSWRRSTGQRFIRILALFVLACAPLPFMRSVATLAVAVVAVGLLLAPLESSAYVLVAELAPAGTMTEAATWVTTARNVTGAAGIALAGVLVDGVGVSWTMTSAWACAVVAFAVATIGRAALRRATPPGPQD
jgi:predicted MFS family arabinose efflux permease